MDSQKWSLVPKVFYEELLDFLEKEKRKAELEYDSLMFQIDSGRGDIFDSDPRLIKNEVREIRDSRIRNLDDLELKFKTRLKGFKNDENI